MPCTTKNNQQGAASVHPTEAFPHPSQPGLLSGIEESRPYRPVQYLGSKLRSLPALANALPQDLSTGGHVLDAFSGSSVVSQFFADRGCSVTATDSLTFCSILASATLGIGRNEATHSYNELYDLAVGSIEQYGPRSLFSDWLAEEQRLLQRKEASALADLHSRLPQAWRPELADADLRVHLHSLSERAGEQAGSNDSVLSAFYAGTYFSLDQTLTVDAIRDRVEHLRTNGRISMWEYCALLTALLTCISTAAFTPGKHFAQFHNLRGDKNTDFHLRRLIADRSIDLHACFLTSLKSVYERPTPRTNHNAHAVTVSDYLQSFPEKLAFDLIYADPPYTGQQYSRFYHIPETLVTMVIPNLQLGTSGLTRGLYPTDRYKSPFCSVRQAPSAFRTLLHSCSLRAPTLALSYSATSPTSRNRRSVDLDYLVDLAREFYHHVDVQRLGHRYRRFNSTSSDPATADGEYLLIAS